MPRHLTLIPGGGDAAGVPYPWNAGPTQHVVDTMPARVIVELRSTLELFVDVATGEITQTRLTALPDHATVFDSETWHTLPSDDTAVAEFLESFNPRHAEAPPSIKWLEKEPFTA